MMNNFTNKSKSILDSVLVKRIFLKFNQQNQLSKEKEEQYIQSLIQGYIKKYIGARIKLNRTWLCIKINYNDKKENKINYDEETNDSVDNLINLFTVPKDISNEILEFLKNYDKYVEIADESKEEYLIDLTSYIINNKEKYFNNGINDFLIELKTQIEKKFNITINIGMGNNILLASLACLKCFIESIEKKNNENNIINDIKAIFEEDNNISNDLISVENNEKDILSFLNNFPLEYLSNSENKYFENFKKLINKKNFNDIKTLGDIINFNSYEIYNIFKEENLYKEIFLFCLGIGDAFHKSQIITNNSKNMNDIKEETFKGKNKSQLIKIYIHLANKLFKQIYFYHYNPRTLILILKTKQNKLYKRVVDKETLFDNYNSLINTGIKLIEQLCNTLPENEILEFNKMIIYFDNIIKLDTIDRNIWEQLHEDDITEIRVKSNKLCFWNNFLNSKSKEEQKIQSKSVDNNSANKDIKESERKKTTKLTSKSINEINKFSKKANLDLLGFNKKRKQSKGTKYMNYMLLAKTNKLEQFGIKPNQEKK